MFHYVDMVKFGEQKTNADKDKSRCCLGSFTA